MNRKWLYPLQHAIVIGVPAGLIHAAVTVFGESHLEYHLFNLVIRIFTFRVDLYTLATAIVLYAVLSMQALPVKFPKRSVLLLTMMLCIGVLAIASLMPGVAHSAADGTYEAPFGADYSRYVLARVLVVLICIVVGVVFLRLLKRFAGLMRITEVGNLVRRLQMPSPLFPIFLAVLLAVNLGMALSAAAQAKAMRERPNIILIMVDTLRADHMGCYGYDLNTTPNIDELANQSIRFERAIAQAPFTRWSVPSIFISQYPQDVLKSAEVALPRRCVTLAEVLKNAGYSTSAIVSNPAVAKKAGLAQGYDLHDERASFQEISSPGVISAAVDRIDQVKGKPFYLFALFMDVHPPYRFRPEYNFHPDFKPTGSEAGVNLVQENTIMPTKDNMRVARVFYDSGIGYTDEHVGHLLNALKSRGLYDNSLIVFFSDHGEEFGDHGGFFHGPTLYEEVLHVPLLVKLPNQNRGKAIGGVFSMLDLFPSVLRLVDIDSSRLRLRGKTVDLRDAEKLPDDMVFSATISDGRRSVTNHRYKYIAETEREKQELFDLMSDRREQRNIHSEESRVVTILRKAVMDRERESMSSALTRSSDKVVLTDKEKNRLESLGYLAR